MEEEEAMVVIHLPAPRFAYVLKMVEQKQGHLSVHNEISINGSETIKLQMSLNLIIDLSRG